MQLDLKQYGSVISSDQTSNDIKLKLDSLITSSIEHIIINCEGVTISTKAARIIFGRTFKLLGKELFNSRISYINSSPTFMFAVNEGIVTELTQ